MPGYGCFSKARTSSSSCALLKDVRFLRPPSRGASGRGLAGSMQAELCGARARRPPYEPSAPALGAPHPPGPAPG